MGRNFDDYSGLSLLGLGRTLMHRTVATSQKVKQLVSVSLWEHAEPLGWLCSVSVVSLNSVDYM